MSNFKREGTLQDLVRTILEKSECRADRVSMRDARRMVRSVAHHDYHSALNKNFDTRQINELISQLCHLLPGLNRKVFSETRIDRLAQTASALGAHLQAGPFDGERGRALRGFYFDSHDASGDPLVYVNTAGHPVSVAAAFWHEVGHHLTHQIFGESRGPLNLSFNADYARHLTSPDEITADIVVALGCYPKRAAERVFGRQRGSNARLDSLIVSARHYIRENAGFDFTKTTSVQENICILARMIHVAKLRTVLLNEYGI